MIILPLLTTLPLSVYLTLGLKFKKYILPILLKAVKCISEVVRIGSIIIFNL